VYDDASSGSGESDATPGVDLADPVLPRLTPELLDAYLGTEVVDARGAVWSGAGAAVALDECWVITAENPFSELWEPAANARAMDRLVSGLEGAGLVTTPLVGRAPDLSWSEHCVAVRGATLEAICAWGRDFDQHAVFLLTEESHAVVSCWTREELGRRPRRR
jgi:hypothetical protein